MTEQLIADLSTIDKLRVISRTSVMQYKKARKPLPVIARELNVDAVVEGSVARAGERIWVTAKLIRAATEKNLWAGSYERDLRDVLALQSEVAKSIVSEVDITLTPQDEARLASARPVDPEAHRLFLLGRFHANKATEDGLEKPLRLRSGHREKSGLRPGICRSGRSLHGPFEFLRASTRSHAEGENSRSHCVETG